ncbi:MAG: hypothetical protein VKJ64_20905 [Leptolyngbyaceae bacterium]|nr:hypothetical protein [Leptolyngbyaceae bacterium]
MNDLSNISPSSPFSSTGSNSLFEAIATHQSEQIKGGYWHRSRAAINRQSVNSTMAQSSDLAYSNLAYSNAIYSHQIAANHLDEMLLT